MDATREVAEILRRELEEARLDELVRDLVASGRRSFWARVLEGMVF